MALGHTIQEMRDLLCAISVDLEKASGGNKAAAQRVRTGTIKLEKVAKKFRKESINAEKSGVSMKKPAAKKAAAKPKAVKMKAKPKAKMVQAKAIAKRPTAKMPVKKF